jgi:hypothetical protein
MTYISFSYYIFDKFLYIHTTMAGKIKSKYLSALEYLESNENYDLIHHYRYNYNRDCCPDYMCYCNTDDQVSIIHALIRRRDDNSHHYVKLEDSQSYDRDVKEVKYQSDMSMQDAIKLSSDKEVGIFRGDTYPQKDDVNSYLYIYIGDEAVNAGENYKNWLEELEDIETNKKKDES